MSSPASPENSPKLPPLVLTSALTSAQKRQILELIQAHMASFGFEAKARSLMAANKAAFEGQLLGMFERVRNDTQRTLLETINDLVTCTENTHAAFLLEFGELVIAKAKAEVALQAVQSGPVQMSKMEQDYMERLRAILTSTWESMEKLNAMHSASVTASKRAKASEEVLRNVITRAHGLAEGIGLFNWRKQKAKILKILEKHTDD